MRVKRRNGYSEATANNYINRKQPIYILSSELEEQHKFIDGKPTNEITGYKAWFTQDGVEPFKVKFETEISLPKYISLVEFENLQAVEVNYNVYFKADKVREVK